MADDGIFRPQRDGYKKRWKTVRELGEGGQGTVYLVTDLRETLDFSAMDLHESLEKSMRELTASVRDTQQMKAFETFCRAIREIVDLNSPDRRGALKVLHEIGRARNAEQAEERIKREIKAMRSVSHPNLLAVLDGNEEEGWFVSRYYPKATLTNHLDRFKGNMRAALEAFRLLVAGVAELHKQGMVHRDIKPDNIFVGDNGELILGDFGIVHYEDAGHTRLSATLENVGSRDWMPQWAMSMRIDDLRPTFDVFALGKVLWSMLSGSRILRLWYFRKPGSNVEEMFADSPGIRWANRLFARCIVEEEEHCLPDAGALLQDVDATLNVLKLGGDVLSKAHTRPCRVCGQGQYDLQVDGDIDSVRNFGLNPSGQRTFLVFACNHCGHVQLFACDKSSQPPAWT